LFQYTVNINIVNKIRSFKVKLFKHSNFIANSDVPDAIRVNNIICKSRPCDVTFVLCRESQSSANLSLALCRFHGMTKPMEPKDATALFKKAKSVLKNDCLERRRSGGSSGEIQHSKTLMKMLHTPNSTPRKSTGSIFLEGTNQQWFVFYINRKDLKAVGTRYSNPVPGGSFTMPSTVLKNSPFLQDFFLAKPYCALILQALKPFFEKNGIPLVCPEAVASELLNIAATYAYCQNRATKKWNRSVWKTEFVLFFNFNYVLCTLVLHDVGYHLDVFRGGPSLENRVIFSIPLRENMKGRSGGTSKQTTFALLDWTYVQQARHIVWTDPANSQIDGSASSFGTDKRISKSVWNAFVANAEASNTRIIIPDRLQTRITDYTELNYND
jgi:hypothetical protein